MADENTSTQTSTRKVIVSEFLSLDGVMQAPGGPEEDTEGDFAHGGWQMPYSDEVAGNAVSEGIAAAEAFLLGRKTYEIFRDVSAPTALRLVDTKTTSTGVVILIYQPEDKE